MVTLVSWNTLESGQGGAWADGWGCPLEIQRWKEELVQWKKRKHINTTTNTISNDSGGSTTTTATPPSTIEAEEEEEIQEIKRLLTNQRYARIRNTIINEMNDNAIDFYLFQELTAGNTWDEHFNTNNIDTNSNTDEIDKNDHDHRFGFESESESEFTQFPPSTYERVPCQEDDHDDDGANDSNSDKTVQRIYVRKESGWKSKRSYTLHSDVLEGGCLVEFQQQHHSPLGVDHGTGNDDNEDDEVEEEEQQQLFLVNLHGNSKKMRDPHLRRRGIMELWKEIGSYLTTNNENNNNTNEHENEDDSSSSSSSAWWWWMEKIIVCGDFNTHLSELIPPTRHYMYQSTADSNENNNNNNNNTLSGSSSSPPVVLLEPVVGLLRNSTTKSTSTGPIPMFSTNHEDGFLAQYDGCLFFRHNPNPNSDVTTPVTTTTPTPTNTPFSSSESVPLSSEGLSSEGLSSEGSSSEESSSSSSSSISSSYLELENVSWNITGFMPKGHGKLPGSSSSEQQQEEHPYYNNFTYHSSHRNGDGGGDGDDEGIYLNGIFLGSGTVPSFGMSDHLRIYTTIRIHNHNNDHPIKEHNYEYEHQRRPPPHYTDTYN